MMKKRAANFTSEEKNELLDAVLRYRDVLFGRVGLPSRFWAAKKAAWCSIVDAVNQVRPTPGRNVHECRRKLKDLKAATRKKCKFMLNNILNLCYLMKSSIIKLRPPSCS